MSSCAYMAVTFGLHVLTGTLISGHQQFTGFTHKPFCKMCVLFLWMCVGINSCNPAFSGHPLQVHSYHHCSETLQHLCSKRAGAARFYCPLDKMAFSTFGRNQLQKHMRIPGPKMQLGYLSRTKLCSPSLSI